MRELTYNNSHFVVFNRSELIRDDNTVVVIVNDGLKQIAFRFEDGPLTKTLINAVINSTKPSVYTWYDKPNLTDDRLSGDGWKYEIISDIDPNTHRRSVRFKTTDTTGYINEVVVDGSGSLDLFEM